MNYYFYDGYLVIEIQNDAIGLCQQMKISRNELLEFLGLEKLSEFSETKYNVGVA